MNGWFGGGREGSDLRRWLEDGVGEEALRKIGIRRGQTVLDFGCGKGNYTIPVARLVGEKGRIYALDKDERSLDELMQRAEVEGLKNIRRMDTSGEIEIRLKDESVDVVLLYDIFWYFQLTDDRLPKLLIDVYRVSRSDALISIYPKHINVEGLENKLEDAGFHLEDRSLRLLIHDGGLEEGVILNFVKKDTEK